MANICDLSMKIVMNDLTKKQEILDILSSDENKGYLVRTYIADIHDNSDHIICYGDCKWSVLSSLIDWEDLKPNAYTLPRMAKEFNCEIEVFGYEEGFQFAEHFIIDETGILDDTCIDIAEDMEYVYDENGELKDELVNLVDVISFGEFAYGEWQI
ncbi:hypothetical protein A9K75_08625 [Campylobacter fetus subsp. testudinum]|uniref:hypothetical protein n=1 Tax=Campylobacter fetus TaxID=196 RepID=UPI0008189874|nr:hypothetical protein [Campylobacter fetus]OCR99066.1 hypothetical protein A9K75_08625 [Campylobacter fetus subsp. testudinum]